MRTRIVSGITLTPLLLSMLTLAFNIELVKAEPTTWTVDDDGPADFSTIWDAVYSASPGDTIYVKAGTYREQVTIDKPLQLIGENKNTTILDGYEFWSGRDYKKPIHISSTHNTSVSGFKITNTHGLFVWDSENVTISGNIIINSYWGIHIDNSTNIAVIKNIVTQNDIPFYMSNSHSNKIYGNIFLENNYGGYCIRLNHSSNNSIYENTIKSNNDGGSIQFRSSFNNRIYGNNITNNGGDIYFWASSNNSIHGNNIVNNDAGINLYYSSSNNISGNNITNGGGIRLEDSTHNDIYENNIITENTVGGIKLYHSSNNSIRENNITNIHTSIHHEGIGILLYESSNNTIYHNNFINYTRNAATSNSVNFWDDGYPSGGNLWSDYPGEDRDGDGVGDTPYVIDNNNRDNFPLMGPWIYKKRLPFWTQWWFWIMITAGIVVLTGTLYFLKRRESLTPTPRTPPAEGTETPMYACAGPAKSANGANKGLFATRKYAS